MIEFSPGIDFTGTFTGTAFLWSHHLAGKQQDKIGAGGGTRTRTTFYSPGILSPVRLPFRHTGNILAQTQPLPRSQKQLAGASSRFGA